MNGNQTRYYRQVDGIMTSEYYLVENDNYTRQMITHFGNSLTNQDILVVKPIYEKAKRKLTMESCSDKLIETTEHKMYLVYSKK